MKQSPCYKSTLNEYIIKKVELRHSSCLLPIILSMRCKANDYRNIITIEPGKRGGKPCVRSMQIAVSDVLGWLAAGMTLKEIIEDFSELTEEDIRACLAYAADRESKARVIA